MKKIITTILVGSVFAMNFAFASTDCQDNINGCTIEQAVQLCQASPNGDQDKIAACNYTINKIQERIKFLSNRNLGTDNSCQKISQTLWQGMTDKDTNGDVTKLENFIRDHNGWYSQYNAIVPIDGVYSNTISNFIKNFQSRNGIKQTGAVGPKTLAKINSMICGNQIDSQTNSTLLDPNSLNSNSSKPIISGTTNLNGITILILSGTTTLPQVLQKGNISGITNLVWSDASDHGGGVGIDNNGKFSDYVSSNLSNGNYIVGVYEVKTVYDKNGFQGYSDEKLLSSGTLHVANTAN